ncbi:MAG: TIGR04255 family protein [Bacilli bacterium]
MGQRYNDAPLKVAVCELRFSPLENGNLIPGLMYNDLQGKYTKVTQVISVIAQAPPSIGALPNIAQEVRTRLSSDDEKTFVEIGTNVISLSRHQPYMGWEEDFQPRLEFVLEAFLKVLSSPPPTIQRIGLRYINEIQIPKSGITLREYFTLNPNIADDMPQEFTSFLMGLHLPYNNGRDILQIQMGTGVFQPEKSTVVLDFDYFLARAGEIALDDVFDWLQSAHEVLGRTFEGCITQNTRDLFGGWVSA